MKIKEIIKKREFWFDLAIIILIFVVYIFHASQLGDWIMDDAGISFVYSRSLANGHGLVSQPGKEPVEGYSNPLWVLILVPFFWLNIFDPIITPKVISAILMFFSIVYLYKGSRIVLKSRVLAGFVCMLMVVHTSIAVWTISGMENPLYLLLAILIFFLLVERKNPDKLPIQIGILAGLIALTRPDGIVFAVVFPGYLILDGLLNRGTQKFDWRKIAKDFVRYLLPLVIIYGGYLLFRLAYFHDIFPNTYYAKGYRQIIPKRWLYLFSLQGFAFEKIMQLMDLILGRLAALCLVSVAFSIAFFIAKEKFSIRHWIAFLLIVPAIMVYVILPADWMREYRFATIFIPFFYLLLVQIGQLWCDVLPARSSRKVLLLIVFLSLFLGFNVKRHIRRTQVFAENPPTPFLVIAESYGDRFDQYAELLGLEDASVLLIDMGGSLYYSDLTIYDLGKLTDREIARTLNKDQQAFHDYIFMEAKPTFIDTYSSWAGFAAFDDDPRFRQDYIPINERIDPGLKEFGYQIYSGTYVRKDALENPSMLELLK